MSSTIKDVSIRLKKIVGTNQVVWKPFNGSYTDVLRSVVRELPELTIIDTSKIYKSSHVGILAFDQSHHKAIFEKRMVPMLANVWVEYLRQNGVRCDPIDETFARVLKTSHKLPMALKTVPLIVEQCKVVNLFEKFSEIGELTLEEIDYLRSFCAPIRFDFSSYLESIKPANQLGNFIDQGLIGKKNATWLPSIDVLPKVYKVLGIDTDMIVKVFDNILNPFGQKGILIYNGENIKEGNKHWLYPVLCDFKGQLNNRYEDKSTHTEAILHEFRIECISKLFDNMPSVEMINSTYNAGPRPAKSLQLIEPSVHPHLDSTLFLMGGIVPDRVNWIPIDADLLKGSRLYVKYNYMSLCRYTRDGQDGFFMFDENYFKACDVNGEMYIPLLKDIKDQLTKYEVSKKGIPSYKKKAYNALIDSLHVFTLKLVNEVDVVEPVVEDIDSQISEINLVDARTVLLKSDEATKRICLHYLAMRKLVSDKVTFTVATVRSLRIRVSNDQDIFTVFSVVKNALKLKANLIRSKEVVVVSATAEIPMYVKGGTGLAFNPLWVHHFVDTHPKSFALSTNDFLTFFILDTTVSNTRNKLNRMFVKLGYPIKAKIVYKNYPIRSGAIGVSILYLDRDIKFSEITKSIMYETSKSALKKDDHVVELMVEDIKPEVTISDDHQVVETEQSVTNGAEELQSLKYLQRVISEHSATPSDEDVRRSLMNRRSISVIQEQDRDKEQETYIDHKSLFTGGHINAYFKEGVVSIVVYHKCLVKYHVPSSMTPITAYEDDKVLNIILREYVIDVGFSYAAVEIRDEGCIEILLRKLSPKENVITLGTNTKYLVVETKDGLLNVKLED